MGWPNVGPGVVSMRRVGSRKGVPMLSDCWGFGGILMSQATSWTRGRNPSQETALVPKPPPPSSLALPPADVKATGTPTVVVVGFVQSLTCCRLTVGGFVGVTVAAWPQTVPVEFRT